MKSMSALKVCIWKVSHYVEAYIEIINNTRAGIKG